MAFPRLTLKLFFFALLAQRPDALLALPRPLPLQDTAADVSAAAPGVPRAQASAVANPPAQNVDGQTLVPLSFLVNGIGVSAGQLEDRSWRVMYFDHVAEFNIGTEEATFDSKTVRITPMPRLLNGMLYVPLAPFAELFGVEWKLDSAASPSAFSTGFRLSFPAAYIEEVETKVLPDRVVTTMKLSNATRIVAAQQGLDVHFNLSAARRQGVASAQVVSDYLVTGTTLQSGSWQAQLGIKINYAAPVQWYTLGSPARVVIEVQRLFEESNSSTVGGGLAVTKIRKGTGHGPVQMFLARVDPAEGWRIQIAPGGYSVLQRARPSSLATRHRALLAINGGFFAYDGAAVGAMLVGGEWIRLPWQARTAIGFRPDGTTQIGRLQTVSLVEFSGEGGPSFRLPVRELNGWPDYSRITALTRRFGNTYTLKPGEIAIVVKNGVIVSKPGGGVAAINAGYPTSFTLVASGGAKPYLEKVQRGQKAQISINAPGWDGITTALGGGPRLLKDGHLEVTSENFRNDVRIGLGPRTAMGVDAQGRYIILVVDGRQGWYSTGLTLTELAYTMQKLGAVDAMNLDGGGSTAMVVRNRVINKPSDGRERSVANALLVTR